VPVNKSKVWTPKEDELLKSLLESGASIIQIALTLKRTAAAVRARVGKLKLGRNSAA
jgi:DNA-binding NarL/FixJ family response regulator